MRLGPARGGSTEQTGRALRRNARLRTIQAGFSLVLIAVMMGMAWFNRQRTAEAALTIDQSEGEVILRSIRAGLRTLPIPPDHTELDSLVSRHARDGLKSIEFYAPDGRLVAAAGVGLTVPPKLARRPVGDQPIVLRGSERIRMLGAARPVVDSSGVGFRWSGGGAPSPGSPRSVLAIEFEPLLASDLLADADQTLVAAVLTGLALAALTLMFLRLSARHAALQTSAEQERRLAALGEMSAVLAHEIRNPLASLKGNAQLLARRLPSGSPESQRADRVVAEAERLEELTSDLLDFARSGPLDIRPTDPIDLLGACVDEVGAAGFQVQTSAAPRSWPLDARRVRQALVNILRNARQASPPGVKADVAVRLEGSQLVYAVRDYGEGIPSGAEDRLFSPFYTTRVSGTGLGLTVARRVAELHGGTVTASNAAPGALFRVVLSGVASSNGAERAS